MSAADHPVDLDTLAGIIADQLEDPTYCFDGGGESGFLRFDASIVRMTLEETAVRAVVTHASDGEEPVNVTAEVIEIVVRRAAR